MATTASNSPAIARAKSVSAAIGPVRVDPSARAAGMRRGDHPDLLVAEQSVLAGVRVQAGHGDPRVLKAHAPQSAVRDADYPPDPVGGDQVDRLPQRDVHRDEIE